MFFWAPGLCNSVEPWRGGRGKGTAGFMVMGTGGWGRRLSQRALLAESKRGTYLHRVSNDYLATERQQPCHHQACKYHPRRARSLLVLDPATGPSQGFGVKVLTKSFCPEHGNPKPLPPGFLRSDLCSPPLSPSTLLPDQNLVSFSDA